MSRLMMSCLLVGVLSGSVMAYSYSGGTGESNAPYQIATAEDLIALGNEPNDYNDCFILTADIDLSSYHFERAVIAPSVNDSYIFQGTAFTGSFDGQGYAIKNMTIDGKSYLGLFGYVDGKALISNVVLNSVDVNGHGRVIGGLAGYIRGESIVSSINVDGFVKGLDYVGGMVGACSGGLIFTCISDCNVSGENYVGGLVSVNGWAPRGYLNGPGAIVISGVNIGDVTGSRYVGGLIGDCYQGGVLASHNSGLVVGNAVVGGLIGRATRTDIMSSYNSGEVYGDYPVGGLVGEVSENSLISSYSYGSVDGNDYTGGLVGRNQYGLTSFQNCFWDMEASGQEASDGGIGLLTFEMKDPNTYLLAGWDFVGEVANGIHNFWQMQAGEYPSFATPAEPNGSGSLHDPYLINDVNELGTVWRNPLAHYRLEGDSDLTGIINPMVIVPWFGGVFDGNGYRVRHYHLNGTDRLGFFGELLTDSQVMDLRLEDVDVNGTGDEIGALVGYNQGVVTSCYSSGRVQGDEVVGGLVGNNVGRVSSSVGACHVIGDKIVGGLVGENFGVISSSYTMGSVSAQRGMGALVGSNSDLIMYCYSAAQLFNDASKGLIGGRNQEVVACFWDAEVAGVDASGRWSTSEMQNINTYLDAGWDFVGETDNGTDDLWWMPESDYPRLWWEE